MLILKKGGIKKVSEKYEYNKEYAKKYFNRLEEFKIRVPMGKKDEYKELARRAGKSLNQFVVDLIEESKNKK